MTETTSNRPLRIFLCHASNDKPAVRELYHRLCADGFAPWLDEENLLPGEDWQYEIPKAVRQSDVVIVCLSPKSSNKEGYVQKEIKFALDAADEKPEGTIFLVPLKLEECTVPDRLSRWQWVTLFGPTGYERLLRALRKRASDLNASSTAAVSTSPAPEAHGPSVSNVSGGVNLEANNVNVGNDVVGRDKIIQAGTYIENVTIIQSAPQTSESKSALLSDHKIEARKFGNMEFVHVPAGEFIMGSDQNDNEKPQHTVEIPYDYWIGKYPVTNEQFAKFVALAKYKFEQGDWKKMANHPVVNVSWHDAMAYSKRLNDTLRHELKGLTLRLPTEAEWEKAARGTQGNEWPWGNKWLWPWDKEYKQSTCNTAEGHKDSTTPVGAYSPQGDSPYGAADMTGNVFEWCLSLFNRYPYNAYDGREHEKDNGTRVLRGGAFSSLRDHARCAFRVRYAPDLSDRNIGFRVVIAPPLPK